MHASVILLWIFSNFGWQSSCTCTLLCSWLGIGNQSAWTSNDELREAYVIESSVTEANVLCIQKRNTNKLESMSLTGFFRFSQKKAKKMVVSFIFFIHCSKCLNIDWQVSNSLLENPTKVGSFVFWAEYMVISWSKLVISLSTSHCAPKQHPDHLKWTNQLAAGLLLLIMLKSNLIQYQTSVQLPA